MKRKDKKNMSEKSPTAEITCACGRLAPESGGKGKVRGGWDVLAMPGSTPDVPHVIPINGRAEGRVGGRPKTCMGSPQLRVSMSSIRLLSWPSLAPLPSGGTPQKRVAVPADFYRFLQRGWTAHCAAQRAKQARSKSAATGGGSGAAAGGGGSGVWEASGEGEGVEVICLDSPTAAGAGQAAAATAEVKGEGGEAEAKRPRRRGRAAAAQQTGSEQRQQAKQEPKEEPDVVMLDADSSDEPQDVTGGDP